MRVRPAPGTSPVSSPGESRGQEPISLRGLLNCRKTSSGHVAAMPTERLNEPGAGSNDNGRLALTYSDPSRAEPGEPSIFGVRRGELRIARFAIARGPGERLGRRKSTESSKTYPCAICLGRRSSPFIRMRFGTADPRSIRKFHVRCAVPLTVFLSAASPWGMVRFRPPAPFPVSARTAAPRPRPTLRSVECRSFASRLSRCVWVVSSRLSVEPFRRGCKASVRRARLETQSSVYARRLRATFSTTLHRAVATSCDRCEGQFRE